MGEPIIKIIDNNGFSIPLIIRSKNPNYFTFLKLMTKVKSSPYYKTKEEDLFPITINNGCCALLISDKSDFPDRDAYCHHNKPYIKFERLES